MPRDFKDQLTKEHKAINEKAYMVLFDPAGRVEMLVISKLTMYRIIRYASGESAQNLQKDLKEWGVK